MKHRKLIAVIATVLAVVLVAGTVLSVAAAKLVTDVDGDGKITAFDAQMIAESKAGKRTLTDTQLSAVSGITARDVLNYVLGTDVLNADDTDNDGVIEIYTADGLQYLNKYPNSDFILMQDLDLEGADWTPVANFSGSLDGNGKTVSNFTINTSAADAYAVGVYNQGFFGSIAANAEVSDLHLQDVTVNAASDATSIGFFAGTLRGNMTGCTVTGTLNDTRETYPADVYTGVMVGTLHDNATGSITVGTTLSISDEIGAYTASSLCANVKLNIDKSALANTYGQVSLAGYTPADASLAGQWTDTTNSSDLRSETLQQRQDKVVDYMNAMGTVQWTPATTLTYTSNNGTDQTFKAGTVYTGLPYNGHNGSLERFLSVMESQDSSGVYTASSDLEDGGYITSATTTNYVRMYYTVDETTGAVTGKLSKTSIVPSEVISFDTTNNTLYYSQDGYTFYLGATASNENLHVTGSTVSSLPAHLYTISSSGKAVMVTNPSAGTAYKLGVKNAEGSVLFFNGESNSVGTPFLYTSTELGDAIDVYLTSVDGGYHLYFDVAGAWSDYGFYLTMGNDCSGAVTWAWLQVSNTLVEDTASHAIPYKGGVYVQTTQYMIPTETGRERKGIYPVGSWEAVTVNDDGKYVTPEYDASQGAYVCTDEVFTPAVLNANGLDTMYEAYAQAHKADGLVCFVDYWASSIPRPAGHARLIATDPVVIRNADGSINPYSSYLLCSEQGAGIGSKSSWRINYKYTFYELVGSVTETPVSLSTKTYLPITIRALQDDYIRNPYLVEVKSSTDETKNFPILSPAEGRMYSYHHINSVTVTVKDSSGKVYYQHEAFTGIGTNYNTYRGRNNDLYMADLHGETFYAAAAANGMKDGRTYYFTVDVLLSTGETKTLFSNRSFKYTAPTE